MNVWAKIKGKLRRFVPVGHVYLDKQVDRLEKSMKKQQKMLEQQIRLLTVQQKQQHWDHYKALEGVITYIDQELRRRDDWGMRAAETARKANGRQVWVIKCPAPEDPAIKRRWGDYAYALTLQRYLERKDIYVTVDTREDWGCEEGADVVLVLRGKFFYRPDRRNTKCVYIMWNISHPDLVTTEEYQLYDAVCIGSRYYAEKLKQELTVPVFPLLQCTDTELFYPAQDNEAGFDREYIFIGNSRGIARNCVMWAIEDKLPIRIWGGGWDKILAEHMDLVEAPFIENSEIPELYRRAKVTLNDHWQDMLDKQFVNNRIFDALACGLPIISDSCEELREIFPDAVLYYGSKEEFNECVRKIDHEYDVVKAKVMEQWDLIKEKYSFEARARELVEIAGKCKSS